MQNPAVNTQPTSTVMVSQFIQAWAGRARRKGANRGVFVLDGAKITDSEVGDASGLLPLFAWHADNMYRYAMGGQGLGIDYREDAESLLQRSVSLDRLGRSTSEMLCFFVEAVEDARQHLPQSASVPGAVELRGLVNQFAAQMGVSAEPAAQNNASVIKPQA